MPSSAPQIPAAAKEALRELDREGRASYHGLMDGGLVELYPHLLAAWAERLLSDEAAEAAFAELKHLGVYEGDVDRALEAALASIDTNGGTR
jgi:hypothetical protein